jgi:hypothetical protein
VTRSTTPRAGDPASSAWSPRWWKGKGDERQVASPAYGRLLSRRPQYRTPANVIHHAHIRSTCPTTPVGARHSLSADEVREAFEGTSLWSWSAQRLAIAMLDAHGGRTLPADAVAGLNHLTRLHALREDSLQIRRGSPFRVEDGLWSRPPRRVPSRDPGYGRGSAGRRGIPYRFPGCAAREAGRETSGRAAARRSWSELSRENTIVCSMEYAIDVCTPMAYLLHGPHLTYRDGSMQIVDDHFHEAGAGTPHRRRVSGASSELGGAAGCWSADQGRWRDPEVAMGRHRTWKERRNSDDLLLGNGTRDDPDAFGVPEERAGHPDGRTDKATSRSRKSRVR